MNIRTLIIMLCITGSFTTSTGAQSLNGIFDKNVPITWLALDFTGALFIGDRDKYGSSSDVKFLIKSWNDLMEREREKYDVGKPLGKPHVENKIDITRNHNDAIDVTEMLTNNPSLYFHLREEDITTIVKSYDFTGLSGIGLMFNVESFNRFGQQAAIWVTFIDLESKEIMFTERMQEAPGGAGLRNYWAGSVMAVLKKIEKKQFEFWRKKYYRP
jgi:hypothetical protein